MLRMEARSISRLTMEAVSVSFPSALPQASTLRLEDSRVDLRPWRASMTSYRRLAYSAFGTTGRRSSRMSRSSAASRRTSLSVEASASEA